MSICNRITDKARGKFRDFKNQNIPLTRAHCHHAFACCLVVKIILCQNIYIYLLCSEARHMETILCWYIVTQQPLLLS